MVCVSRSRWGGSLTRPSSGSFFSDRKLPPVLYRQKLIHNWVSPPRPSQARPPDTAHPRYLRLAARTLRSVENTPSKFGHDPCPVRRGLVAAVKCCVRKSRFFFAVRPGRGTEQEKPEPPVGFNTTKGKNCFFFVFRSHNCRLNM